MVDHSLHCEEDDVGLVPDSVVGVADDVVFDEVVFGE